MGSITPDKKLYDNCTVEVFQRIGWKAFSVARSGRYKERKQCKTRKYSFVKSMAALLYQAATADMTPFGGHHSGHIPFK